MYWLIYVQSMRIVSLVPSWTETLIEAGVDVVGRTRFCIHPRAKVAGIPAVCGTKDWEWERLLALRPDLLVLDREENPKFMAEQSDIPFVDTHVTGLADVPGQLQKLAIELKAPRLLETTSRWTHLIQTPPLPAWDGQGDFPGLLEWGTRPLKPVRQIEYVIWKKPWMAVSKDTFIGSVLGHCGFESFVKTYPTKYPSIELTGGDVETLLLFSSEPFPFAKIFKTLAQLNQPYALVDGESFSWFGLRTLRFLERVHGIHSP